MGLCTTRGSRSPQIGMMLISKSHNVQARLYPLRLENGHKKPPPRAEKVCLLLEIPSDSGPPAIGIPGIWCLNPAICIQQSGSPIMKTQWGLAHPVPKPAAELLLGSAMDVPKRESNSKRSKNVFASDILFSGFCGKGEESTS